MKCFDSIVNRIQNGGNRGSENRNKMIEESAIIEDQTLEINFGAQPQETTQILDGVNSVNTRQFRPLIGGRLLDLDPGQPSAGSDSDCLSESLADDLSVKSVALDPFKFDRPAKKRSQSYRKKTKKSLTKISQSCKKQNPRLDQSRTPARQLRPPNIQFTEDKNSDSSALSEKFIGIAKIKCPICDIDLDPKGNSSYVNRHIDNCLQTFRPVEKKPTALKSRNLDKGNYTNNKNKRVRQNSANTPTKNKILEFLGSN